MPPKTYFEELSYALRGGSQCPGRWRTACSGGVERTHPVPGHGERRCPV